MEVSVSKNQEKTITWLHISDLHVFQEADTKFILEDYAKLAERISPQFLIATGDFRHITKQPNFGYTKIFLESILKSFHIEKKDTFLVPGNHDVSNYCKRKPIITQICLNSTDNYSIYSKYLDKLYSAFFEYEAFVRDFYKDSGVTDERIINPSKINCILWNNSINILLVNTALISDGDNNHKQIIDINALSDCHVDPNYPTIMLGHHWIESLYSSHHDRVESIIDRRKVSAYLHGDIHKYNNKPIQRFSVPNRTIPSIACSKSAPQSGDLYSDVGVVYYEWKNDNNVYVQAYKWTQKGFREDSIYLYDINKKFHFPMICDYTNQSKEIAILIDKIVFLAHNQPNIFMDGAWVKEAESIWLTNHNEIIGRSLLLFYYNKAKLGMLDKFYRAREIYYELEQIPSNDLKTQTMLLNTKKMLFPSER